jgi:hypothetical protein
MPERSLITRLKTQGGPSHQLLELLDRHRVMTTLQLARATGAPERTVLYRLTRLREAQLVDAARPGREAGSSPMHWWLRAGGAQLVSGVPLASGSPSAMFVAHAAAISEVYLALVEHGPAAGVTLTDWAVDRAGWQTWAPPGGYGHDLRLTPDGTAHADVAAGAAAFCIEVDLATTTQNALKLKVERYLAYARAQAWWGVHPHCPPMLLLTTTPGRAATFIRAAQRILNPRVDRRPTVGYLGDAVTENAERLVVAACGLLRDPARAVTEPVWTLADPGATEVTLAELLGERVAAAADAAVTYARLDAEREQERIRTRLHRISHDKKRLGRIGALAAAVIDRQRLAAQGRLLEQVPELAHALLAWDAEDTPETTQAVRVIAERMHWRAWSEQAHQVLDAHAAIAEDRLSLYRIIPALLDGRHAWHVSDLAEEDHTDERGRHDATVQLAAYRARRDRDVAGAYERLSWHRRRRTNVAQLVLEYDREHLSICGRCGLLYPHEWSGSWGWREPDQVCRACDGDIEAWHPEVRPTGLTPLLDRLRARVADVDAALATDTWVSPEPR